MGAAYGTWKSALGLATIAKLPRHKVQIEDLLIGEHLLLIGNQGVGKNKLADRLLQLRRLEDGAEADGRAALGPEGQLEACKPQHNKQWHSS